jgi:hypothetical protein
MKQITKKELIKRIRKSISLLTIIIAAVTTTEQETASAITNTNIIIN